MKGKEMIKRKDKEKGVCPECKRDVESLYVVYCKDCNIKLFDEGDVIVRKK